MANQFDAEIRFKAVAWRAYDKESGLYAYVIDEFYGLEDPRWFVKPVGQPPIAKGTSKTPTGGRAACRRAIARYMKKKKEQPRERAALKEKK